MMAQLEPWAPDQPGGVFKEPTIHETWLVVEKEKGWADIQPLNLQIMRVSDLLPDDFHPDHQRDYQAASNAGAFSVTPESPPPRQSFLSRLGSLPRAMFPSFRRPLSKPSAPAPDEEKADHPNDPIQGVQVSVVVKFPSAIDTRSSRHSADSLNGDYALGVRNVGWAPEFSALMTRDHSPQSI